MKKKHNVVITPPSRLPLMRKNENEVGLKEEQKAADGFREVIFFPIVQIYKSDQDSRQMVYA